MSQVGSAGQIETKGASSLEEDYTLAPSLHQCDGDENDHDSTADESYGKKSQREQTCRPLQRNAKIDFTMRHFLYLKTMT